jgi:hypothetical protein
MQILFCGDPFAPRSPDTMYATEVAAAEAVGLSYHLINFERLVHEARPFAAITAVPFSEDGDLCLFRGWMMTPAQYTALYEALQSKGLTLINDPAAYRHCHYSPENYPLIESYTAPSVWVPYDETFSMEKVIAALTPFGDKSLILKDYVKSRKHEWAEACFIPSASDTAHVERVVQRFLELQGEDLNEGLVFREYLPFRPLTTHSKSGMPLTVEYRCFVLDGDIVLTLPYWEEGDYAIEPPPLESFRGVARRIPSRCFTMDIAQHEDGRWFIVELGDGQVAGLPDTAAPESLYHAIASAFHAT